MTTQSHAALVTQAQFLKLAEDEYIARTEPSAYKSAAEYFERVLTGEREILSKEKPCAQVDIKNIKGVNPNELAQATKANPQDVKLLNKLSCALDTVIHANDAKDERVIREHLGLLNIVSRGAIGVATTSDIHPYLLVKAPQESNEDEATHEAFVAMMCLNKLRAQIPNFSYVFGVFRCSFPYAPDTGQVATYCNNSSIKVDYVVYENITPAVTLNEYARTATPAQLLNKYLQVILSLRVAYKQCAFTHYDLHAGNILVRRIPGANKLIIPYPYPNLRTIWLECDAIATIIDYGYAFITYKGKAYGNPLMIQYAVQPYPMHDAYKLLLMLGRTTGQHNNIATFNMLARIFKFFNPTESFADAVRLEHTYLYALPIDPYVGKITHDDLLDYLVTEFKDMIQLTSANRLPNDVKPITCADGLCPEVKGEPIDPTSIMSNEYVKLSEIARQSDKLDNMPKTSENDYDAYVNAVIAGLDALHRMTKIIEVIKLPQLQRTIVEQRLEVYRKHAQDIINQLKMRRDTESAVIMNILLTLTAQQ